MNFSIDLIAGARPNFVKIASIIKAIETANANNFDISYRLVHTGQHFDHNMSKSFFDQLNIPNPHVNLNAGGGTQSEQTANIMIRYESLLDQFKPSLCLVVGDVTSTLACSIVARKAGILVAHVEAGIRSGDWSMPEEINRVVTDSISNLFFTTSKSASQNLINSGIQSEHVFFVGNTMIDTLLRYKSLFYKPEFWDKFKLESKNYLILTLHRPSNVDDETILKNILDEVAKNSKDVPIIFPVHPRIYKKISTLNLDFHNFFIVEAMSYLEFNYLVYNSLAVITDSGGITEETTVLGIPCITLRDNTERPETVEIGTNELIGNTPKSIEITFRKLFSGKWKKGSIPELWDGNAAIRIVDILIQKFEISKK